MAQVAQQTLQDQRREFDLSDDGVATPAEQAPHPPRRVTVVDNEIAVGCIAEQASVALPRSEFSHFIRCEPILPHEASAEILCLRRLRVQSSPLAESLVPTFAVSRSVLPIPNADAGTTLTAPESVSRELALGSIDLADSALHAKQPSAVAWRGSSLDAPCHADVLLEIANAAAGGVASGAPKTEGGRE